MTPITSGASPVDVAAACVLSLAMIATFSTDPTLRSRALATLRAILWGRR
jgi:hypothetical protein